MSNIFCCAPFASLDIQPNGKVAPCCRYSPTKAHTISTYFGSNDLRETKEAFLNNKWPSQCKQCKYEEQVSGHSIRLGVNAVDPMEREIKENKNNLIENNIKHVSISTSNVCNLKCLMCYYASFARHTELHKLNILKDSPVLQSVTNDDIEHILNLDKLETLTVMGGEPFYDKTALELINRLIDRQKSKNIKLHVNTNLTCVNRQLISKIKENFKEVLIKGSIDGIGLVNDYIRYPSKWTDILDAVKIIKEEGVNLSIVTALSNLSLLRFYEVVEWVQENNIIDLYVSPVHSPTELACNILPNELKNTLLTRYLELRSHENSDSINHALDTCIKLCQQQETNEIDFQKTIKYLKIHDSSRGNNLTDIFSELKKYIIQ